MGEFAPPSVIGNLDAQNASGKTEGASAMGHGAATGNGPSQKRALAGGGATKGFGEDRFKAFGSSIQGMTPEWRRDDCSTGFRNWRKPQRRRVLVQFEKEASQTRDWCVARGATQRAARPDPSLRKNRLLGMTTKPHHYPAADLARFLASLRKWDLEYRLPRQRAAPQRQGASSSPS